MKIITFLLLLICPLVAAETRTKAELEKALAAAQAALAVEQAHSKAMQTGTQKLTDAVKVQIETNKGTGEKLQTVAEKIMSVEETAKAAAETTEQAAKKLAKTVDVNSARITFALSAQADQQKQSLAAAQEVARKLERANADLIKTNEESRIARVSLSNQLSQMSTQLEGVKAQAAIIAAEDRKGILKEQYSFWNNIFTQFVASLPQLAAIMALLIGALKLHRGQEVNAQKTDKISAVQDQIQIQTNGKMTAAEERIAHLERENALLRK